jgi:4-hydroxybenzoate polyprenyltransferase
MATAPPVMPQPPDRWRTYLRERFPLGAHGPVVAAFAGGVMCAGAALRSGPAPAVLALLFVFLVVLGFFFQLRVADEWKDAETDRLHRPERPVPRGLVTLRELATLAGMVAVVQLVLTVALSPALLLPLALVWVFGAWMTVEFFLAALLRGRPLAVLLSHGMVVPVITLFILTAEAAVRGDHLAEGSGWVVAGSFFAGNVVEVGRKLLAPADERPGVETYSGAWGPALGATALGAAALLAATCGALAATHMPGLDLSIARLALVAAIVATPLLALAVRYAVRPSPGASRAVAAASGVWTLAFYLLLGPVALWLS